jgi:hypothetical protein
MGESGSPKSVPGSADRVSELLRAVKAKLAADTVKRGLYCCSDETLAAMLSAKACTRGA